MVNSSTLKSILVETTLSLSSEMAGILLNNEVHAKTSFEVENCLLRYFSKLDELLQQSLSDADADTEVDAEVENFFIYPSELVSKAGEAITAVLDRAISGDLEEESQIDIMREAMTIVCLHAPNNLKNLNIRDFPDKEIKQSLNG